MAGNKALLVACAALLPGIAVAQNGMVVTSYPSGVINNPGGEPTGTVALTADQSYNTLTFADRYTVTSTQLQLNTNNQCAYLEGPFEDGFQYSTLNTTRWKDISAVTLDHCPTPGAVGAANNATCTAMLPGQFQFGVPLPNYPTGDLGMIMTLSQTPCQTAGACCVGRLCANWAGAHLTSQSCILYGVLETEAAFDIPAANGGVFFSGFYMYGSGNRVDPSWNEVDQTFINGPNGLEFHASLFVSNPPNTANAQEDKDVFDSTGTQCMSYVPPAGQPGNLRGKLTPYTCPTFDGRYASQFHTYKVVWTPKWIAWLVDTTIYRNSTASPWRPVTMRPLLRTNVGTAAAIAQLPDAHVYVRRIRYTPLDWPGTTGNVVADALTSTSMSSKYGSMQKTAGGMVQITTPGMSQQAAAASRRRLAQLSMGNTLSVNQTIIPNPTVPIPLTGYQRELANVNNLTQTVIANAIPGLLPSQIAVTVTGHTVKGVIWAGNISFSQWTPTLQVQFLNAVSGYVTPNADKVLIGGTYDASLPASWGIASPGVPVPASANLRGVLIAYIITGYSCDSTATASAAPAPPAPGAAGLSSAGGCSDAGFSVAAADVALLNLVGATPGRPTSLETAFGAACPGCALSDMSPGNAVNPGSPTIAASISVGINMLYSGSAPPGTPEPTDVMEAQFNAALYSGLIASLLAGQGVSVSSPTPVEAARLARAQAAATDACNPVIASAAPDAYYVAGGDGVGGVPMVYKRLVIAILVVAGFTGLLVIGVFITVVFLAATRSRVPRNARDSVKIETPMLPPSDPAKEV